MSYRQYKHPPLEAWLLASCSKTKEDRQMAQATAHHVSGVASQKFTFALSARLI
jgi:hypothetical protein